MGQEVVAVIGGGYAGMAAAATLAKNGIQVTVFEAARDLGGRARKVSCRGIELDNGQHILLGAYSDTLALIESFGEQLECLRIPLELKIDEFALKLPRLPAPLHLAAGLLLASGISFAERLAIIRFMLAMKKSRFALEKDESVQTLLNKWAQSENVIKHLWEPLCVSALNTPIVEASARIFLNVLRDALMGKQGDSDMLLPSANLSKLLPEKAAQYLAQKKGKVLTSAAVERISKSDSGFIVHSAKGEHCCKQVICALPPYRLPSLLENFPQMDGIGKMVGKFTYQPICTAYLQYPQEFSLHTPLFGQATNSTHWFFDRGIICGQKGLIAGLISAQGPHLQLAPGALAAVVHQELKNHFPQLQNPLWSKVISEKRATFSCTVDLERPQQLTPIPGLHLAGDYTAGDYPATIEGAVRSGMIAASNAMKYFA